MPAVAAAFLILADARPAQAVSAGCLAVRGGALNISGNFDLNNYQNTFEAGETIVWTITGQPSTQNIQVDLAAALTVTGGKATFTFTTSGTHRIDQNLDIGVDPVPTMTAICLETTAEKQDAIKNAIKTLSEMQLTQSLYFQQGLLQQLTDTFLTGALPVVVFQHIQGQIAHLLQLGRERVDLIARDNRYLNENLLPVVTAYNNEIDRRNKAQADIDSVLNDKNMIAYRNAFAKQRELLPGVLAARQAMDDANKAQARASEAEKTALLNDFYDKVAEYNRKLAEYAAPVNQYYQDYPFGPAALWGKLRAAEAELAAANANLPGLEAAARAIQPAIDAARSRIVQLNSEVGALRSEIGRLENQASTLRTQFSGPPATPFAASQLQGAMGFASSMSAGGTSNGPIQFSGSAGQVSFFADLNAMRRAERERDGLGFNGLGPDNATGLPNADMPYNVWFKGSYSVSDSNQPGADRDSRAGLFATGAYYAVTPTFMVGTMYRFRDARSTSVAQGSDLDSRGHGAGVYSTWVVTPILSVSGQALYEWSRNDFRRSTAFSGGTSTGQFDATQLIVTGQVQGTFSSGAWWLRPTLAVTYARAEQHSFVDSAGTFIDGQTSERGQVSFGPRIGYKYFAADGVVRYVEPSVGVAGTWDFVRSDDTTLASGVIVASDVFTAQFSAGLNMQFANAAALSFSFGYSGFGRSQVESLTVSGQLSVPLALQ